MFNTSSTKYVYASLSHVYLSVYVYLFSIAFQCVFLFEFIF